MLNDMAPLLVRFGLQRSSLQDSLHTLISSYNSLDAIERKMLRATLTTLGFTAAAKYLDPKTVCPPDTESSFICPVVKHKMVVSCAVASCRYYIDRGDDLNCLLIASAGDKLSPLSMSKVLGLSAPDVEEIRDRSLRKMRTTTLAIAREQRNELPEEFVFLKNAMLCGVCEKNTGASPFYVESDISFCSAECLDVQSPIDVLLEAKYGVPAGKIIKWAIENFDTEEAAAQAIGYPVSVLKSIQSPEDEDDPNEQH